MVFPRKTGSVLLEEVGALMQLFRYYMKRLLKIAKKNNVRVQDDRRQDADLIRISSRASTAWKKRRRNNTGLTFVIAVNYGGRDEITRAAAPE